MDMDTEYAWGKYLRTVSHGCPAARGRRPPAAGHPHARLRSGTAPGRGAVRGTAMSSPGDVVELVRIRAGALTTVEPGDHGHVRLVELEVEDGEVLLDPAAGDRLREDNVPALDVPAQRDLRRAAAQPLGDAADD